MAGSGMWEQGEEMLACIHGRDASRTLAWLDAVLHAMLTSIAYVRVDDGGNPNGEGKESCSIVQLESKFSGPERAISCDDVDAALVHNRSKAAIQTTSELRARMKDVHGSGWCGTTGWPAPSVE